MTMILFGVGLLVVAPGLSFVGYRLSKRLGHKKPLVILVAGGAFLAFMGLPVVVLRLTTAFKEVGHGSPEEKSRLLSEGISRAITEGGLLVSFGLLLALLGALAAAKFQRAHAM